jgi:hypothetical protein
VIEHSGSAIDITDVKEDWTGSEFVVSIAKRFNDDLIESSLDIGPFFVNFMQDRIEVDRFPARVSLTMTVFCLGKAEGGLSLVQPEARLDWQWYGKTRFRLHGPKKVIVNAHLIVFGAGTVDIGRYVLMKYADSKSKCRHELRIDIRRPM